MANTFCVNGGPTACWFRRPSLCAGVSTPTGLLAVLLLVPGLCHGGALYLYEMSNASETGYGGAGLAARANDAGTVFTNPAGMARFDESKMLAGAVGVYIDGGFKTNASTSTSVSFPQAVSRTSSPSTTGGPGVSAHKTISASRSTGRMTGWAGPIRSTSRSWRRRFNPPSPTG